MDFAPFSGVKIKESRNIDKYFDLAREQKKLWNMKGTVIPFVVGASGTVLKGLEKRLEELENSGKMETIQTTAL